VGKRRLEKALAGFGHADEVEVVYRSFELDPTAPHHGHELTTGVLARKYGRSEDEMLQMQQQLTDLAAEEGLAFRLFENVHTNTIDAHRLLHLALETGGPGLQGEVKEALLAAYFLRAENVGDHEVLTRVATGAGLDEVQVKEILTGDGFADAVQADIARARAYGATGVPFFVVDERYGVSGAQSVDVFTQVLDRAWVDSRPALDVVGGGDTCGPDGCPV
jgi:predicted DsbA family dithiol-disulfide isomerase